jgi:hypothetical protein
MNKNLDKNLDSIEVTQNYLMIDKVKNNDEITELKEHLGKLIIKQYSGVGTDNFVIKKFDGKKISFSFFKLNGIHYISINGEHILDYRKFVNIQKISKIEKEDGTSNSIEIRNSFIGNLVIHNCDIEIFKKALDVMNTYMKNHRTYMNDFIYLLMN